MVIHITNFQRFMVLSRKIYALMSDIQKENIIAGKFMDQFNIFGKLPKKNAEKIIDLSFNIENIKDM
jgi:hypothetical protein